ncbi:hypothetical protein [Methylomonas methanica]|uniref:Uncharacterized protein n=1 Tax=Methylomonas methanica TaxID=421 RepID=A0A177LX64_METMH|nr:hypothetical protein [Methylomonas methanica]OAH97863.1 hypothetical protein A1332_21100 [Methylomonas methanica]
MNEDFDPDDNNSTDNPPEQRRRYFGLEQAVFILLVVLSLLGIAITEFNPHDGYGYWLFMVIVFGMLSIFVSWLQTKTNENDFGDIVKAQGLHWLHTLVVVIAAALLNKSEQLSDRSASLVILLILALATMLDGIRIGWQYSLLGFFLATCALIVAYFENFMPISIGLGVLVTACTFLWEYWRSKYSTDDEN